MLAVMGKRAADAVQWLLGCDEPAIRHLARRDLLGERSDEDRGLIATGPAVNALLSGQETDGGFGGDPYRPHAATARRSTSRTAPRGGFTSTPRRPATRRPAPPPTVPSSCASSTACSDAPAPVNRSIRAG